MNDEQSYRGSARAAMTRCRKILVVRSMLRRCSVVRVELNRFEETWKADRSDTDGKRMTVVLLFGDRLTTINDPKKEIGPGLLHDMLSQLGLKRDDLL